MWCNDVLAGVGSAFGSLKNPVMICKIVVKAELIIEGDVLKLGEDFLLFNFLKYCNMSISANL